MASVFFKMFRNIFRQIWDSVEIPSVSAETRRNDNAIITLKRCRPILVNAHLVYSVARQQPTIVLFTNDD